MNLDKVFQNNEKWIKEKIALNATYFDDLGKGQILNYYILAVRIVVLLPRI